MLVKVNNSNFVRDTESMAIINLDNSEKIEYYNKVKMIQNQKNQINNVREEIDELRSEISDIKQLLIQLIDKSSNG